jgi:hypothetical protein
MLCSDDDNDDVLQNIVEYIHVENFVVDFNFVQWWI